MSLIRLLVIALIVYLVIQIFKRWMANKSNTPLENQEEKMVACDICQLHIPENEALQKDGKYYCSQEHLEHKQD
ncbi:MAG: metallothionein [Gammaproteobacteria bacterium]|nr:metallothionein [Gammaproteobacteria bacterium]